MIKTWKMDDNDDLDVSTGRVIMLEGVPAIAQILKRRIRTFVGEYFLSRTSVGVRHWEDVLTDHGSAQALEETFSTVIIQSPGITALARLDLEMDEANPRQLNVDFEAKAGDEVISNTIPLEF